MEVSEIQVDGYEKVARCRDQETGLHAIVAKQNPEPGTSAAENQKVAVAVPDDIESAQEDKGEVPATK